MPRRSANSLSLASRDKGYAPSERITPFFPHMTLSIGPRISGSKGSTDSGLAGTWEVSTWAMPWGVGVVSAQAAEMQEIPSRANQEIWEGEDPRLPGFIAGK